MIAQRCGIDETERARICLALTCGLPGAGKTFLCKALLAYGTPDILVRHICVDDFLQCEPSDSHEREENDGAAFKVVAAPILMHAFYASSNDTGQDDMLTLQQCGRPPGKMCLSFSSSACWIMDREVISSTPSYLLMTTCIIGKACTFHVHSFAISSLCSPSCL